MASRKKPRIPFQKALYERLLNRTFAYDFLVSLFVCLGGIANAMRAFKACERVPGWLWVSTAVGGLLFSLARIYILYRESAERESVHELLGCLHVLYRQLVAEGIGETRLRLTIHVPKNAAHLQQIVEYVSEEDGPREDVGRTMLVNVGIVGLAYRTKEVAFGVRESADDAAFIGELVSDWAYTVEQAAAIDKEAKCWLAVPIASTEEESFVLGVLFADSTDADFFTPERLRLAHAACAGIATYVARRYS